MCPICGLALIREHTSIDMGTILEDSHHCPDGHYFSDFAYGGSREILHLGPHTREWIYNWEESDESAAMRKREYREAVKLFQRLLFEDGKLK